MLLARRLPPRRAQGDRDRHARLPRRGRAVSRRAAQDLPAQPRARRRRARATTSTQLAELVPLVEGKTAPRRQADRLRLRAAGCASCRPPTPRSSPQQLARGEAARRRGRRRDGLAPRSTDAGREVTRARPCRPRARRAGSLGRGSGVQAMEAPVLRFRRWLGAAYHVFSKAFC